MSISELLDSACKTLSTAPSSSFIIIKVSSTISSSTKLPVSLNTSKFPSELFNKVSSVFSTRASLVEGILSDGADSCIILLEGIFSVGADSCIILLEGIFSDGTDSCIILLAILLSVTIIVAVSLDLNPFAINRNSYVPGSNGISVIKTNSPNLFA